MSQHTIKATVLKGKRFSNPYTIEPKDGERYITVPGFDAVQLEQPIQWRINPFNNRAWLHSFVSLRWLTDDLRSDDVVRRENAATIVKEFLDWATTPDTYYWYGAGDHTTGIRLELLIEVRKLVLRKRIKPLGEEYDQKLLRMIKLHVKRLLSPKVYNPHHNHGLLVDISLLKSYRGWPSIVPKGFGIDYVVKRMAATIKNLFDDMGQTTEHSMDYQLANCAFAINAYKQVEQIAPQQATKLQPVIALYAQVTEMMVKLATKKNREFHPMGATVRPRMENRIAVVNEEAQKAGRLLSREIESYQNASFISPSFFIYNDFGHATYSSLACMDVWMSHAHKHNDDLSFTYSVGEHDLIDECGYHNADTNYERQKHELCHNGMYSPDIEWNERKSEPKGSFFSYFAANPRMSAIWGEHQRMDGVLCERVFIMLKPNVLILADRVKTKNKARFYRHFQTSHHNQLQVNTHNIEIKDKTGAVVGKVQPLEEKPKVQPSKEVPRVTFAELVNVLTADIEHQGGYDWSFTVVEPDGVDVQDVKVTVGPQKARLNWQVSWKENGQQMQQDLLFEKLDAVKLVVQESESEIKTYTLPKVSEVDGSSSQPPQAQLDSKDDAVSFETLLETQHSAVDLVHYFEAQDDAFFDQFNLSGKIKKKKILEYYIELLGPVKEEELFAEAENITKGLITIKGFEPKDLGENDKSFWQKDPYKNRTWQWGHHSWTGIWALIKASYVEGGNNAWLVRVKKLIHGWSKVAFMKPGSQEMLWHDHSTALRLDRLIAFYVLKHQDLPQTYQDLVRKMIVVHTTVLSQEAFYTKHTNHGYDQALALYQATHPDIIGGLGRLHELAYTRLMDEISFGFTDEGVHKENSPAYHRGMVNNIVRAKDILTALPYGNDNKCLKFLDTLLNNGLYFSAAIAQPNSTVPILGDSIAVLLTKSLPHLRKLPNYKYYQYAATNGQEGKPYKAYNVFEESGYAVLRKPIKRHQENLRKDFQLIFKCGFLSPYHRHDDDTNLLLYAYGEPWLIDSGMYNHQQKDPVRIYMRSAFAHNIPMIPRGRITRSVDDVDENWGLRKLPKTKEMPYRFEGESGMFKDMRIKRQVEISDELRIAVSDQLDLKPEIGRDPVWLFHVPHNKQISVEDNKVIIRGRESSLCIEFEGAKANEFVITSGMQEMFHSVVSHQLNALEDSQLVRFEPKKRTLALNYQMYFIEH